MASTALSSLFRRETVSASASPCDGTALNESASLNNSFAGPRPFEALAKKDGSVEEALVWTAARPGKGIMRNAVLFAAAFSVMLFAPLTPYITVGAFIVCMMLLSALLCLVYIPALIMLSGKWLVTAEEGK